ncbi:hypothetical protein OPQ81_003247 [Rhizoctonia solani]|nr:hypothetical protein OPQ81_003247 [Rhizoctonia solani]
MEEEWKEWAGETERTERMRALDETYPSKSFSTHALSPKLSRQDCATLVQLRFGHLPTASYLHKLKKADSPTCPHCKERAETLLDFLMRCKAHDELRRETGPNMWASVEVSAPSLEARKTHARTDVLPSWSEESVAGLTIRWAYGW